MPTVAQNSDLQPVTRGNRCPICNRGDWCSVAADGSACICMRVENGAVHRTRNGGFLHRLKSDEPRIVRRGFRTRIIRAVTPGRADLTERARQYQHAVDPDELETLAAELGVTTASLERLGVGWCFDFARNQFCDPMMRAGGAWCFPMRNGAGEVCGLRLRFSDGSKTSAPGGREGLFIPADLPDSPLLIAEGATDCAALLDLGFSAIGKPNCSGGTSLIVDLVSRLHPSEIVIVADADAPGQRGASNLATVLLIHCRAVRVIAPPAPLKDARAWKQGGAVTADIQNTIDAAPVRSLSVVSARRQVRLG